MEDWLTGVGNEAIREFGKVLSSLPLLQMFTYLFLLYAHECFADLYVYVPRACLVPLKVRRGHQIPCNTSYK